MWPLWTSKNYIFFHTDIFQNCISSSVYVCVCVCGRCMFKIWQFSIYYKFTIKELLKLTKGITWRHSNIVISSWKLEKIKFTKTLKNIYIYIYAYIYIYIYIYYIYIYMCVWSIYYISIMESKWLTMYPFDFDLFPIFGMVTFGQTTPVE